MRLTRAQNVLRLAGNVQNRVDFWGSAPDPAEGAYDAPSDSLVVRGFLPSAIAASRRAISRTRGNCFHHSEGDIRHWTAWPTRSTRPRLLLTIFKAVNFYCVHKYPTDTCRFKAVRGFSGVDRYRSTVYYRSVET